MAGLDLQFELDRFAPLPHVKLVSMSFLLPTDSQKSHLRSHRGQSRPPVQAGRTIRCVSALKTAAKAVERTPVSSIILMITEATLTGVDQAALNPESSLREYAAKRAASA